MKTPDSKAVALNCNLWFRFKSDLYLSNRITNKFCGTRYMLVIVARISLGMYRDLHTATLGKYIPTENSYKMKGE